MDTKSKCRSFDSLRSLRMTDLQEALRMTDLQEMRHPALVKNEAVRELSR